MSLIHTIMESAASTRDKMVVANTIHANAANGSYVSTMPGLNDFSKMNVYSFGHAEYDTSNFGGARSNVFDYKNKIGYIAAATGNEVASYNVTESTRTRNNGGWKGSVNARVDTDGSSAYWDDPRWLALDTERDLLFGRSVDVGQLSAVKTTNSSGEHGKFSTRYGPLTSLIDTATNPHAIATPFDGTHFFFFTSNDTNDTLVLGSHLDPANMNSVQTNSSQQLTTNIRFVTPNPRKRVVYFIETYSDDLVIFDYSTVSTYRDVVNSSSSISLSIGDQRFLFADYNRELLWAGGSDGVKYFDISAPDGFPVEIGDTTDISAFPPGTSDTYVYDTERQLLYVATAGSDKIEVIDMKDPANPVAKNSYSNGRIDGVTGPALNMPGPASTRFYRAVE